MAFGELRIQREGTVDGLTGAAKTRLRRDQPVACQPAVGTGECRQSRREACVEFDRFLEAGDCLPEAVRRIPVGGMPSAEPGVVRAWRRGAAGARIPAGADTQRRCHFPGDLLVDFRYCLAAVLPGSGPQHGVASGIDEFYGDREAAGASGESAVDDIFDAEFR